LGLGLRRIHLPNYIKYGYVDESEHQESRCSYGEDVPNVHFHSPDLF
jgi:hypothetical protein